MAAPAVEKTARAWPGALLASKASRQQLHAPATTSCDVWDTSFVSLRLLRIGLPAGSGQLCQGVLDGSMERGVGVDHLP